jgi:hypothetical protein
MKIFAQRVGGALAAPQERRTLRGARATYRWWAILGVMFLAGALGAAEPRTLVLYGAATNTTAEATANVQLVLAIDGEKVTAQMKTEAPLVGTGKLEGRMLGSWLELSGTLEEGFQIQFRGVLNERDFRGTYLAAVPGEPVQYGKFRLAVRK